MVQLNLSNLLDTLFCHTYLTLFTIVSSGSLYCLEEIGDRTLASGGDDGIKLWKWDDLIRNNKVCANIRIAILGSKKGLVFASFYLHEVNLVPVEVDRKQKLSSGASLKGARRGAGRGEGGVYPYCD